MASQGCFSLCIPILRPAPATFSISAVRVHGTEPNHIVVTGAIGIISNTGPWEVTDYAAGVRFATEQGWIIPEGTLIRLTTKGHNQV